MNRFGRVAVLWVALLCLPAAAMAQVSPIDLGTLGGMRSSALAINQSGQIAGWSELADGTFHAVLWTAPGSIVAVAPIPSPHAAQAFVALNDAGHVAGGALLAVGVRAFIWSADAGLRDLGTLGGATSVATDINARGQVVGWSQTAAGTYHGFSWTDADGMVDLGPLALSYSRPLPLAVNDRGQVVGTALSARGTMRVFVWSAADGMADVGPGIAWAVNSHGMVVGEYGSEAYTWTPAGGMLRLGTLGGSWSVAYAVNDYGRVAGTSQKSGPGYAPESGFSWSASRGLVDLSLSTSARFGYASAVSAAGQIVGTAAWHAFSWTTASGVVDLGTLGGARSSANAVNDRGQVVGNSLVAGDAAYHATLWNVPESLLTGFHGLAPAPALNEVIAGHTVAVTFSVADNQGLGDPGIIQPGYPSSQRVACHTPDVPATPSDATGSSGHLSYKAGAERYTYAWRTDPTWAGTCRALHIHVRYGTPRVVYFSFR